MKKIINIFQYLTVIILLSFVILNISQKIIPSKNGIFGFRTFSIASSSMNPKLKIGDIILVKKIKYNKIKIGDIITYKSLSGSSTGKNITHIVTNIKKEEQKFIFYTKGYKTDVIDPAVYEEQVYGKVVYVSKIMSVINKALLNPIGFIILLVIPLTVLFISEIKDIKKMLKNQ